MVEVLFQTCIPIIGHIIKIENFLYENAVSNTRTLIIYNIIS